MSETWVYEIAPGTLIPGPEMTARILADLTRHAHLEVMRARSFAMAAAMTAQREQVLAETLAADGTEKARSEGVTLLATTGGTWQAPAMPAFGTALGWREAAYLTGTGMISPDQARTLTAGTTEPPASASPGGEAMLPASRLADQAGQETAKARSEAAAKRKAAKDRTRLRLELAGGREAAPRAPELTPAGRLAAALAEPLGLDQAELDEIAPYGQAAPGMCKDCLAARAKPGSGRCWYCAKADELRHARAAAWTCGCHCASEQVHLARRVSQDALEHGAWEVCGCSSRREHQVATGFRRNRSALVPVLVTSLTLFWIAAHGEAVLFLPAVTWALGALIIICGRARRRRETAEGENTRKGSPGGRGW